METNEQPDKTLMDQWHDDPANWKWGVFYFNKKDHRIFPPKRIKSMGWTVNFANPYSLICLAGVMVILLMIKSYVFTP